MTSFKVICNDTYRYDFLLVASVNHVSISYHFRDIITFIAHAPVTYNSPFTHHGFNRPLTTYDFLLVLCCYYSSIFHRFEI